MVTHGDLTKSRKPGKNIGNSMSMDAPASNAESGLSEKMLPSWSTPRSPNHSDPAEEE
jgi:hypothetical protein